MVTQKKVIFAENPVQSVVPVYKQLIEIEKAQKAKEVDLESDRRFYLESSSE